MHNQTLYFLEETVYDAYVSRTWFRDGQTFGECTYNDRRWLLSYEGRHSWNVLDYID